MVRLEILQRCMEYCSAAGSMFCMQTSSFPPKYQSCKISAHSVEKWLRYSQYKHLLLDGSGGSGVLLGIIKPSLRLS